MSADTPTMMMAVLEHLASLEADHPSESKSDLTAAMASLSAAFDLSLDNEKQVRDLTIKPHTLESVFSAGASSLGAKSAAQQLSELQSSEAFCQFVKVVSTKGYFKGVEEGSAEYDERMSKLVAKFKARTEAASGSAGTEAAGPTTSRAAPASDSAATSVPTPAAPSTGQKAADEKKAEEVKGKGNNLLQSKDYEGAEKCYSEALELSPEGPKSHVYLCNRAAALCYLGRNNDAVVDCQDAIKLNPSYAKAYTRLGYAFFQMEDFEMSADAYKKSLEIEPGSAANIKILRKANAKLGVDSETDISTAGADGSRAAPDLSGLASMMGGGGAGGAEGAGGGLAAMMAAMGGGAGGEGAGGGGLAGMLNNPGMMAQAQQMMQNPAMMSQVQKMMSNPAMMQGLMGMMGGGGGGGGGGGPDLSALAGMMGGAGAGGTGGGGVDADDEEHTR